MSKKNYAAKRFHNHQLFEDRLMEQIDNSAGRAVRKAVEDVTRAFKGNIRRRVYIDKNGVRNVVVESTD